MNINSQINNTNEYLNKRHSINLQNIEEIKAIEETDEVYRENVDELEFDSDHMEKLI